MIKRWIAECLIRKIQRTTNHDITAAQFEECIGALLECNANIQLFFELFHEFGHYSKAVELKGTVIYIRIEQFLFIFNEKGTIELTQENGNESCMLCYFEDTVDLCNKLKAVAYEGMSASHSVLALSMVSVSAFFFNLVNSKLWKLHRKGSDGYLYYKYFISHKNAVIFNDKAEIESIRFKQSKNRNYRNMC